MRCFSECSSDVAKTELEDFLKNRFISAQSDGTLQTLNWENEPLPAIQNKTQSSVFPKPKCVEFVSELDNQRDVSPCSKQITLAPSQKIQHSAKPEDSESDLSFLMTDDEA